MANDSLLISYWLIHDHFGNLTKIILEKKGKEQIYSLEYFLKIFCKRYFIVEQQLSRYFEHYSECLYHPLPFYATQITNHFLSSRISANHDKVFNLEYLLLCGNISIGLKLSSITVSLYVNLNTFDPGKKERKKNIFFVRRALIRDLIRKNH